MPRNARLLAGLWVTFCVALALVLAIMLPRSSLNSSVLALLPQQTLGAAPPELQQGFMQRLDRQLVWLVAADDDNGRQAARWWQQQLQTLPELKAVEGELDD